MKWYQVDVCDFCYGILRYSSSFDWYNFDINNGICQSCGLNTEKLDVERNKFLYTRTVARWVSTSKWYNPLSWRSGFWLLRQGHTPEQIQKLISDRRPDVGLHLED